MNGSNKISGWMRAARKQLCVWAKEAELKCVHHAFWFLCPDHTIKVSIGTKLNGWVGKTATWQTEHELRNLSVMWLSAFSDWSDCEVTLVLLNQWNQQTVGVCLWSVWGPLHYPDSGSVQHTVLKPPLRELDGGKLRETQQCEEAIKSRNEGPPSDL